MKPSTVITFLIVGVAIFVMQRNENLRWGAMEDQISTSEANAVKRFEEVKRMLELAEAKEHKINITNMIPQAPAPIVHIQGSEKRGPENMLIPPFADNLDDLQEK